VRTISADHYFVSVSRPITGLERALIVNADEFGLTEHVNFGIIEAHERGAVTSTTMLANMWAFEHAAALARAHPTLAVGVHLNLTHGRPVLPPEQVPTLVDDEGQFYRRSPFIRRLLRGLVRIDEVAAECRAQVEKVRSAGIEPSHLDSHESTYMYPAIFSRVVTLAQEFGLALRLPEEPMPPGAFHPREAYVRYAMSQAFFKNHFMWLLARSYRPLLRARGVPTSDHFMSTFSCFRRSRDGLQRGLARDLAALQGGVTELMVHPGYSDARLEGHLDGGILAALRREEEIRALTSDELLALIRDHGIRLTSYHELRAGRAALPEPRPHRSRAARGVTVPATLPARRAGAPLRAMFLVPYPTEGASNRLRVEQYFPYLREHGVQPTLHPFMSSALYRLRYTRGRLSRKAGYFFLSSLRRLLDVLHAGEVDVLFVHREAFPIGGHFVEQLLAHIGVPMVFDFDDAVYLPSPGGAGGWLQLLKRPERTARVIELADLVIAGNENLAAYARRYNPSVTVIPTPVDTSVFRPASVAREDGRVVIGWVGSDTTAPYLLMIREALERVVRRHPQVEIQVIGGTRMPLEVPNLVSRRWTLEGELDTLRGFDIGIMPMPDSEWTRGKCGFKALLYMSVGVPPVCSPVGVTNEIIHDGINGLLASSTDEWVEKLSRLIDNTALRRQMGRSGRLTVEERFSLSSQAPRFLEALEQAVQQRPRPRRALAVAPGV